MLTGYSDSEIKDPNSDRIMPTSFQHPVDSATSFFPNQEAIIKNFLFTSDNTITNGSVDRLPDSNVLTIPTGAMINLTKIYNDKLHQEDNEPVQIFNPYTEKATADYD
jgi:hypothetical protein